jgi:hypothetical protein
MGLDRREWEGDQDKNLRRKAMVIYHLVIDVHPNKFGELWESNSYFSDVFPTLDLAVEVGKEEVRNRIDELLKKDTSYEESEIEEFIEENIRYKFIIYEFDPVRRHKSPLRKNMEDITLEKSLEFSAEIEWNYDYKGELCARFEM